MCIYLFLLSAPSTQHGRDKWADDVRVIDHRGDLGPDGWRTSMVIKCRGGGGMRWRGRWGGLESNKRGGGEEEKRDGEEEDDDRGAHAWSAGWLTDYRVFLLALPCNIGWFLCVCFLHLNSDHKRNSAKLQSSEKFDLEKRFGDLFVFFWSLNNG